MILYSLALLSPLLVTPIWGRQQFTQNPGLTDYQTKRTDYYHQ